MRVEGSWRGGDGARMAKWRGNREGRSGMEEGGGAGERELARRG